MATLTTRLSDPTFVKALLTKNREVRATLSQVVDTNIESTASFYYDVPGTGLKSTQQLKVDWSQFQNHTFFNSAEVNVNVSFDRIINHFPFDGTKKEYETFFEKLTGFEKWVYDRFPKSVGYLNFSGSAATGTVGTHISVAGTAGTSAPNLSDQKTAINVLDPGLRSFTVETHLFVPETANANQVVFQKLSGAQNGFSFHLLQTGSATACRAVIAVVSGSESLFTSADIQKGRFNHIAAIFDRQPRKNRVQIFVNSSLVSESTSSYSFGDLGCASAQFLLGSGSAVTYNRVTTTPGSTFSGSLDEFRFFHEVRSAETQRAHAKKAIYANPSLKLYYKFNEPSGTLISTTTSTDDSIVIDSSGNELHSYITNFSYGLRSTGSVASPITSEKLEMSPVLFPAFADTLALNTELLFSASEYDAQNPNLITRLVPSHYFREGREFDGLDSDEGNIGSSYDGTGPREGQLGAAQLLSSFLYVWAKFFDEMKLYVDAFSTLFHVDYNNTDTVPDNFLPFVFAQMGISPPSFFSDASIQQYIDAENIQNDFGTNTHALQYVQNQIHRRILTNLSDIIKSKGTLHSIKSLLRTVGIDPDNSVRIREFGGPSRASLGSARERRTHQHRVIDLRDGAGFFMSAPLSGSRYETGFPPAAGTFVKKDTFSPHGISSNQNDGLLTSGSFEFEGTYKFPIGTSIPNATQSLVRFVTTGTLFSGLAESVGTVVNVIATSGTSYSDVPAIRAYIRPCDSTLTTASLLTLQITGTNIFDGDKWSLSVGRIRNDQIGSAVSASYFLRVGKQDGASVTQFITTSSYFFERAGGASASVFESKSASANASGTYIVIGTSTLTPSSSFHFLNDSLNVPAEARVAQFVGQASMLRFWSLAHTDSEWREHVRNYRNIGVDSPSTNFSFNTTATGSFEKLRLDVSLEQTEVTASSAGVLRLFDFSQNSLHMNGTGLTPSRKILQVDTFSYSTLSPVIDEASTDVKVRVKGFKEFKNVTEFGSSVAPVYEPEPSELPVDDTRFTIEFSVIDALNRDIINIFSTLDELDSALGNVTHQFEGDYIELEMIRNVYFNRLTDKLNLRAFFEYFKWFDTSISSLIEQLVPRKTRFFGTNFVVESHMLERARKRYFHSSRYLGENTRVLSPRDIMIQQVSGRIKKF